MRSSSVKLRGRRDSPLPPAAAADDDAAAVDGVFCRSNAAMRLRIDSEARDNVGGPPALLVAARCRALVPFGAGSGRRGAPAAVLIGGGVVVVIGVAAVVVGVLDTRLIVSFSFALSAAGCFAAVAFALLSSGFA